ncbi:oxidoreductase-like protein [Penicillium cf. griseofulvum]|nr:oxidoreductase-like protein [Penicillium cf. griseofulvum]
MSQRAIQIQSPKVAKLVTDAPIPKIRDDYVKVKTVAVALNPTDWKHIDFLATEGAIVGCDYSGVVEEVGSAVTNLNVGDKVAGFVHGSKFLFGYWGSRLTNLGNGDNIEDGAFAEHIVAKAAIQMKIPENISFEEASTLGVGITTVGQGLYQSLELPWPSTTSTTTDDSPAILIYGGSTATGTLAIQFAKLSGFKVLATASPHNFDLLRSLGADEVFDYHSPTVGAKIRAATNDRLTHVFDCIASESSVAISAEAISSAGGTYSSLLLVKEFPRADVHNKRTLAYTGIGETYHKGGSEFAADQSQLDFQVKFWELSRGVVGSGQG